MERDKLRRFYSALCFISLNIVANTVDAENPFFTMQSMRSLLQVDFSPALIARTILERFLQGRDGVARKSLLPAD